MQSHGRPPNDVCNTVLLVTAVNVQQETAPHKEACELYRTAELDAAEVLAFTTKLSVAGEK